MQEMRLVYASSWIGAQSRAMLCEALLRTVMLASGGSVTLAVRGDDGLPGCRSRIAGWHGRLGIGFKGRARFSRSRRKEAVMHGGLWIIAIVFVFYEHGHMLHQTSQAR